MKMSEMKFSKNVTLKGKNIETIQAYMYKTRKNFSATLNIIIEDWDSISLQIEKMKREQEFKDASIAKVLQE